MLSGVHLALARAAADLASVGVLVPVRVHESAKAPRAVRDVAGYQGKDHRRRCKYVGLFVWIDLFVAFFSGTTFY